MLGIYGFCFDGRPPLLVLLQVVPSGSKERLAFLARQMDVDILVTGHTHEFKVHR